LSFDHGVISGRPTGVSAPEVAGKESKSRGLIERKIAYKPALPPDVKLACPTTAG